MQFAVLRQQNAHGCVQAKLLSDGVAIGLPSHPTSSDALPKGEPKKAKLHPKGAVCGFASAKCTRLCASKTAKRWRSHRFLHKNLWLKGRAYGIYRRTRITRSDLNTRSLAAAYSVVPAAVHNAADYRTGTAAFGKLTALGFIFFLFYRNLGHKIKSFLSTDPCSCFFGSINIFPEHSRIYT